MKSYIAYFDILGFKDFILNSEEKYINTRMGHLMRDIEFSLSKEKGHIGINGGYYADIKNASLNALLISDTIIFWTNDCSKDNLIELLDTAYRFNSREILNFNPLRGCLICGNIEVVYGNSTNNNGGAYRVNCVYGKAIVKAYLKSEKLNFAGAVIDQSVLDDIMRFGDIDDILSPFAMKYKAPYKGEDNIKEEFVLKLMKESISNDMAIDMGQKVAKVFDSDNRDANTPRAKEILKNTLKFLCCHVKEKQTI